MSKKLLHRYCARVMVEATTPLKIGTGESGLNVDELVATDANRLPMIPGTAITGVLRHSFNDKEVDELFGFQNGSDNKGSRFIFSEARIVGDEGKVIDGLNPIDFNKSTFYSKLNKLVVRDHCRINHRGVADADNHGKFDSQVVYKGARFVFDIELIGSNEDKGSWDKLLGIMNSPLFRVGGGTRKGFGELKIIGLENEIYDLTKDTDKYLNRSSKLSLPKGMSVLSKNDVQVHSYELELTADNFFTFSLGAGDDEADNISKKEIYITWNNGKPSFTDEKVLISATSVKGAISHRTAFHYNRLNEIFADKVNNIEDYVGEKNDAVKTLFGSAKDSDQESGQRGRVILSDVYIDKSDEKILNHVAIDRFTGGAMDGALFDEKVTATDEKIVLRITVESEAFEDDKIKKAFESTLKDISTGMLPLGGSTMRGHGCFSGTVKLNGETL